ncbi:MAG: COG1361 S-layer family protein [Candidatus Woesearchaeota archaeon]
MRGWIMFAVILMIVGSVYADTPYGQVTQSVNVQVSLLNQEPDPAQPGRYVNLRFRVENLGAFNSGKAMFELVTEFPFSLDAGDSAERELGTLYGRSIGDGAATLFYKMRVDKNAIEGDNYVRLRYSIDGGSNWVLSDKFAVRVQSVYPIVGIEDVDTTPDKIEPGMSATVVVTLKNYADAVMEDVTLALDLSSSAMPFAPVDSTSEKKVKFLGAGESKAVVFEIMALGNAASQLYKVPITISYYDSSGTAHTKEDILALVVGAKPDITTTVDSQTVYSGGKAGTVTVKFVNKGVTDVKFLNVELLESDSFELYTPRQVYIGDLDSDDYETAEFGMFVKSTKERSIVMPIRLEYTDPNNERFGENFDLELKLYSGDELKRYGLAKGSSFTGIVILLVIVVGGYYLYSRRKKKPSK